MGRRVRRSRPSPLKFVSFKVSEKFFDRVDNERKRFFNETGISLTQINMSNLIIDKLKPNFLETPNLFGKRKSNGSKKSNKK